MQIIPFLNLSYQHQMAANQIQEAITRVSTKNWFVLGNEVEKFEQDFAVYTGAPWCIGVGNGLDALTFAIQSLGIKEGDEVIVPAHTYVATWLAVSRTGAHIVPVEPDLTTCNIDVSRIEEKITSRTKAILPVHLYGQACDMTSVHQLARKHSLYVIEDNAQAQGARWLEKLTGSSGDVNATSFYPTKNLGAWGDGGAVTTFKKECSDYVRLSRNYGSIEKNVHAIQGSNSRLDELQAAILNVKLSFLDKWNDQRRTIAARYLEHLKNVGDLILPRSAKEAYHVYHQFVIRTHHRDALRSFLLKEGIETQIHYPTPPFLQPAYNKLDLQPSDYPASILLGFTVLSLPIWPGLSDEQIDFICEKIATFFR